MRHAIASTSATKWCDACSAPKPPGTHHCRRCKRCVYRRYNIYRIYIYIYIYKCTALFAGTKVTALTSTNVQMLTQKTLRPGVFIVWTTTAHSSTTALAQGTTAFFCCSSSGSPSRVSMSQCAAMSTSVTCWYPLELGALKVLSFSVFFPLSFSVFFNLSTSVTCWYPLELGALKVLSFLTLLVQKYKY
jgi:hypothetical protein